jgi:hypothetical protein
MWGITQIFFPNTGDWAAARLVPNVGRDFPITKTFRRMSGLIVAAALAAGGPLDAHARDQGQYSDSPEHIRNWFKRLNNSRMRLPCCEESDCARTEARTRGGSWEAKAPDGSWLTIPHESIVTDQGNPTGEPILCSFKDWYGGGWMVFCFVPGPGS